jgi:HSP20 family protein
MIFRRVNHWPAWQWRNQWGEMDRLRRELNALVDSSYDRSPTEPSAGVFPLMNVSEDSNNFYIRAELPGIKADDLEISVTGDSFSISGERKIPEEQANSKYHRRERESGNFSRVLNLPSPIDTNKVEANASDGILKVTLPKSEAAKPKQITVSGT